MKTRTAQHISNRMKFGQTTPADAVVILTEAVENLDADDKLSLAEQVMRYQVATELESEKWSKAEHGEFAASRCSYWKQVSENWQKCFDILMA